MRRAAPLAAVLLLCSCGTPAERIGRRALRMTPQGRRALSEYDRYARVAHVLKKFHDSKNLDDKDLLDILRAAGVFEAPVPAGKPSPQAPKPFPVPVYAGAWRWPLEAGVVSSEFGPRWGKTHQGIDIAADSGTPILACAPGEVIYAGNKLTGYGNVVIVRHDQDTTTTYAHNKRNKVKLGDKVETGRTIALLGSTGHSTGPHLHLEVRLKNRPVNPREKLPKSRF